ncbi:hypothetical protein C8R44DRAFT_884882 [Mycena epipterygia]|nr:hypothetical protein C8R44DRAFT_884882 [Mycena epipterygia]
MSLPLLPPHSPQPTANTTANNGDDYRTHPSPLRFLHPDDYVSSTCVFYVRTTYVYVSPTQLFPIPGSSLVNLPIRYAGNQPTAAPPTAPPFLCAARAGTWGVWRGRVRCVGMVGGEVAAASPGERNPSARFVG